MDAEPPRGFVPARIVRRADHAPDLATFWLAPDVPVPFAPGQYVTLAVRRPDGAFVRRAYSVASAPHERDLELFVECVAHGALTPCLFRLADGDTVWVRARAAGRFLLDPDRRCHVMAATVTGIAPFRAMLRDHVRALAAGETRDASFLVLYGASHAAELGPYADELALLPADWLTLVPTVSRPWARPGWTGETGRVEEVLRKHFDARGWDPADVSGYACGNPDMVAAVPGLLRRAGVDPAHVHEEIYYTSSGDAVPIAGQADDAPATPVAKPSPARPPGPPGGIVLKSVPRA